MAERDRNDLSMQMKIFLICLLFLLSIAIFVSAVNIIKQNVPYMNARGYELVENSTYPERIESIDAAFLLIKRREGVVNMTLEDLMYNERCGGYEYGVYVSNVNLKYKICQNGKYEIYKPVPASVGGAFDPIRDIIYSFFGIK